MTTKRTSTMRRRLLPALAIASLLTGVISVVGAPAASAHAEIVSISPADTSQLPTSPTTASVTFNEAVTASAGAVQLLDANGKILVRSGAASSTNSKLTIKVPTLKPGRYVLRWHVLSADGHPETQSSAFSVKTPTPAAKPITVKLTDPTKPDASPLNLNFSGSKPGLRTITMGIAAREATVELKSSKFGAPIIMSFTVPAADMNAGSTSAPQLTTKVMIPASGVWQLTVRARTSLFDEAIYTGSVNFG